MTTASGEWRAISSLQPDATPLRGSNIHKASRMEDLGRPPSKAMTGVAVVLSLFAAAAFGAVAIFLWFGSERASLGARCIFSAFFLVSLVMLFRAAFTSRRALSRLEARTLSWGLIGFGMVGAIAGLFFTSNWGRGSLVAASISCAGYGLSGLRRLRR